MCGSATICRDPAAQGLGDALKPAPLPIPATAVAGMRRKGLNDVGAGPKNGKNKASAACVEAALPQPPVDGAAVDAEDLGGPGDGAPRIGKDPADGLGPYLPE